MMTIRYLSVVTITCIFGYGAAQTTATPPEADSGFLYLQRVTKDVYFSWKCLNCIVYTLSLESSTSLGPNDPGYVPNHPEYDYDNWRLWFVKSPKEALAKANEELA